MIIDNLHQAILNKINAGIQGLATVAAYPHIKQKIAAPAVLLQMEELQPGEDRGTDQTFLISHWSAWPLLAFNATNARVGVAQLTADLMHLIRGNRWGVAGCGAGRLQTAAPDEFNADWEGYYTWRVQWTHEITIGQSAWKDDGKPPADVWVGWASKASPKHKADYTELQ